MNELQELVPIVSLNKLRSSRSLELLFEEDSKMLQLYNLVAANHQLTDSDAAQKIYGDDEDLTTKYYSLKNKLKTRLIDGMFLIDLKEPSYNDRYKAFFECHKKWASAMTLIAKNAKATGIQLCKKLLRQTTKFEFTELSLEIARSLRLHYGTIEGDLKKFEEYQELCKKYEKLWLVENHAEDYYTELVARYVNNKATKLEVNAIAEKYLQFLKPDLETYDSFKLKLCGLLIEILVHTSLNDYQETVAVCKGYLNFFEQKEYDAGLAIQICLYQLVVCSIQLKDVDYGNQLIKKCERYFEEGSFNWFKFQELFFLLSMHAKEYNLAAEILYRTKNSIKFESQPDHIQETWRINEAYVWLLSEMKKIPSNHKILKKSSFKWAKYENETLRFSQDKRGMNIPISISIALQHIVQRKFDKATAKIEALKRYSSRYLKQDDTFRSNCFMKILAATAAAGFHKVGAQRKAENFVAKLKSNPIDIANQPHEVEIIPYEDLWDMTLELLPMEYYQPKHRKRDIKQAEDPKSELLTNNNSRW